MSKYYLPVEDVLSDVDLFLEGLQFVLSDCLWEGLSCVGRVPEKQIGEDKSTKKKKSLQSGSANKTHCRC